MSIEAVYNNYFQKSKTFLFPLLGIRKGLVTSPQITYISWEGYITVQDMKLICLYYTNDPSHGTIEPILYSHPLFIGKQDLKNNKRIYIFDMSSFEKDFKLFLKGMYSKLSVTSKIAIIDYFGTLSAEYPYLESFLYPEIHYELYSSLLDIDIGVLKETVELCNIYDADKENLSFLLK